MFPSLKSLAVRIIPRFRVVRNSNCDILIFDQVGETWVRSCLPSAAHILFLHTRNEIPIFLTAKFFLRLLRNLYRILQGKFTNRLALCWIATLCDHVNPKVIVSCADNNRILHLYSQLSPNRKIVLIQNALRSTRISLPGSRFICQYFSFGEIEKQIFSSRGIFFGAVHPVGSVKLGLALARQPNTSRESFDLCFISTYREAGTTGMTLVDSEIDRVQRLLFKKLVTYGVARGLSIVVLCKNHHPQVQENERAYFSRIIEDDSVQFVCSTPESRDYYSYLAGLDSDLIVHSASTLGFELFSAGKKVLFGASANLSLVEMWGVGLHMQYLPEIVKLQDEKSETFMSQCDSLRNLSTDEFIALNLPAAHKIISAPKMHYPHEIIRAQLEKYL
jgi:surface carbohydrate biosynthesis protein